MKRYTELLNESQLYAGETEPASVLITTLADAILELQTELVDERYRHDRYVDYSIYEGKRLESLLKMVDSLEDLASRSDAVSSATLLDVIATWRAMDDLSMRARQHGTS